MAKQRYYTLFFIALWSVTLRSTVEGDTPPKAPRYPVPQIDAEIVYISPEDNRDFFIIDVPLPEAEDTILRHWNSKQHRVIINGGYFNPDFSPTGYCKIQEKVVQSAIAPSLSGFVALDDRGRLSLLTKQDDLNSYPTVLQNGPFIIDPGGGVGIHSRLGKDAARTAIGTTEDGTLVILVTAPIDLYDLARVVKRTFPTMERMLNLDGGPSSALKTATVEIRNTAPVRNYLAQAVR